MSRSTLDKWGKDRRRLYQSWVSTGRRVDGSREETPNTNFSVPQTRAGSTWTVRMYRMQPAQARHGVDWVTLDEASPSPDKPRSLARPIRVALSHQDTADSGGPSRHRSTPVNGRKRSQNDEIEGFTPNKIQRDHREGRMTGSSNRRLKLELLEGNVPQHCIKHTFRHSEENCLLHNYFQNSNDPTFHTEKRNFAKPLSLENRNKNMNTINWTMKNRCLIWAAQTIWRFSSRSERCCLFRCISKSRNRSSIWRFNWSQK